jgi:microcystin-dependent protein
MSTLHGNLNGPDNMHVPYAWTFADAAARQAAVGVDAAGVGKLARQLSDNSLWMLAATDPIKWVGVGGDALMPGTILTFAGSMGGTENKHPVDAATGEVNTAYALCDGGTYTAPDGRQVTVPDLRDRFIVGASGTKAVGTTGGSAQVTATVQETTLTQAQMPSHPHGWRMLVSSGSGSYGVSPYLPKPSTNAGSNAQFGWHNISSEGGSQPHGHGLTSDDEANLPPYYAVAYIMKL